LVGETYDKTVKNLTGWKKIFCFPFQNGYI